MGGNAMRKSLFNKQIEPNCSYCANGYVMNDEETCICEKYGFIQRKTDCKKFKYQPLKRKPPLPLSLSENEIPEQEDFLI